MTFYRRRLPHWQPAGKTFFLTWRLAGSLPRAALERLRQERERLELETPEPDEAPRDRALRIGLGLFALADELLDEAASTGFGPTWLAEPNVARIVQGALHHGAGADYELHRYVIMPNHVHVLLKPVAGREGEDGNRRLGGLRHRGSPNDPMSDWGQESQAGKPAPPLAAGRGRTLDAQAGKRAPPLAAERGRTPDAQAGKPAPPLPAGRELSAIVQGLKGYTAREANRALGRRGGFWQAEGFDHWIRDEDSYRRCVRYIDQNPVEAKLCRRPEDWAWGSAGEASLNP